MSVFYFLTLFLFILLAFVLSVVILMQESKASGLGASFGGDPTQSLFGTSTADVLRTITAWLSFFFLLFCVILSLWTSQIARAGIEPLPIDVEEMD